MKVTKVGSIIKNGDGFTIEGFHTDFEGAEIPQPHEYAIFLLDKFYDAVRQGIERTPEIQFVNCTAIPGGTNQ